MNKTKKVDKNEKKHSKKLVRDKKIKNHKTKKR